MFDDIVVPKSYLKGLLTKDQENLILSNSYQTKSLDRELRQYKIYKQKLFVNDKSLWNSESPDTEQRTEDTPKKYPYEKGRWNKVSHTGEVIFYDSRKDKEGNSHWVEFRFVFLEGKLDAKYLEEFYIQRTAGQTEEEDRKWKEARKRQLKYEKSTKYKIYFFLFKALHKLTNRIRKKVTRYDYDYGTTKIT